MNMEEKGKKILDMLVELRRKRTELDKLYKQLEFQAILMLQGIDPQQIERMGSERFKYWKDGNLSKEYVNTLIMKDGTEIILERPIEL